MKTIHSRIIAFVALSCATALSATPLGDTDVDGTLRVIDDTSGEGNLEVDGGLDVRGGPVILGTKTGGSYPEGAGLIFTDDANAQNPTAFTFLGYRDLHEWIWQSDGEGTPVTRMKLDQDGVLTIYGSTNSIVFNPDSGYIDGLSSVVSSNYTFAAGSNLNISGPYSVGFGRGTNVSGAYSIGMGQEDDQHPVTITGSYAFGMGQDLMVEGSGSFVYGFRSDSGSSAHYSMAFGRYVRTYAPYSTGFGAYLDLNASYSMAFGCFSDTFPGADYSIAGGYNSRTDGEASVALGFNAQAVGDHSAALNGYTIANGDHSLAVGHDTTAEAYASVVIGQYNLGLDASGAPPNATAWEADDPVFEVGIGNGIVSDPDEKKNALTVYKDGSILVGVRQGDVQMGPFTAN